MELAAKRILLFGNVGTLNTTIANYLVNAGAEVTFVSGQERTSEIDSIVDFRLFHKIDQPNDYLISLNTVLNDIESFHGILFAFSEGTLRPLSMTKPLVAMRLMEVNYLSFVELVRVLVKKRKIEKGGSIVALSSISSVKGLKTKMAYAASKAALNSAVLNMSAELASKKIRVNAILKGALSTDFEYEHVRDMEALGGDFSTKTELGLTEPQELARQCMFLLSDSVLTMTGNLLKLDGGYSL